MIISLQCPLHIPFTKKIKSVIFFRITYGSADLADQDLLGRCNKRIN